MTLKEEKILKNTIKQMVRESIFDFINGGMSEKKSEDSEKKEKKHSKEESKISEKRKKRIIHALKDKTVDVAQYAYRLWPDKDEDSARSYFYKCLDGKTNDSGDVYTFTDDEFVQLESFLTDVVPEI
jgi:hypothetical protein